MSEDNLDNPINIDVLVTNVIIRNQNIKSLLDQSNNLEPDVRHEVTTLLNDNSNDLGKLVVELHHNKPNN